MNRSPLRLGFLLNALALAVAWIAPWQLANAQCPQICDSGFGNTAVGDQALAGDAGVENTAVGFAALLNNQTTGLFNTAIGYAALENNRSGLTNTALGSSALASNTTGGGNTAIGAVALDSNTTGSFNTATGSGALGGNNNNGNNNTASGFVALQSSTTGSDNTAEGFSALRNNTTGSSNIAIGSNAGLNCTTGSNNIVIGNSGVAAEGNTIRIGTVGTQTNTFIAGIRNAPLANGAAVAVGVTADGQLGVRASSTRFKDSVKPMNKASEAIFSLQPVTFRYKKDAAALPQFGLIAEEVAKVNPDLVLCDAEGKPFTVRYDEINAMLLNEFLKEHRKGEQQGCKIEELEATVAKLQSALKEQSAQIQKVSAQLEVSKPLLQTIANN